MISSKATIRLGKVYWVPSKTPSQSAQYLVPGLAIVAITMSSERVRAAASGSGAARKRRRYLCYAKAENACMPGGVGLLRGSPIIQGKDRMRRERRC